MITAITCTGSRPEAFKLCATYMRRQTIKEEVQWVVISDDFDHSYLLPFLKELPTNIKPELYKGPNVWKPGANTHAENLLTGLEHVKGDNIFFFEDDDWYSPRYLQDMASILERVEIAGEANASYYNLSFPGWRRMQNYAHASLCQTGIVKSLIPLLQAAIASGNKYFDIELWKLAHRQVTPCAIFSDVNLCIGMKGMPGREGIGVGHEFKGYMPDPRLLLLRKWLKDDAANYLPYAKGLPSGEKKQTATGAQASQSQSTKAGIGASTPKGKPKSQAQKTAP